MIFRGTIVYSTGTGKTEIAFECEQRLRKYNYMILASIDLDDSFSEDGLIVARHPNYDGIGPVDCSRRSRNRDI